METIRHHSKLHGSIGRARLGMGRLAAHGPTADDWWGAVERSTSVVVADRFDDRVRPWRILGVLVLLFTMA